MGIVAAGSLVVTLALSLALARSADRVGWHRLLDFVALSGPSVLNHIGWGFGVVIPSLLGFYIVVLGQGLVDEKAWADRRQTLSIWGFLLVITMAPAVTLSVATALSSPATRGTALVVVPAALLMFSLGVNLVRFNIADTATRLHRAKEARDQAVSAFRRLSRRSRRPAWTVLTVNALVATCLSVAVACVVAALAGGLSAEVAVVTSAAALVAAPLAVAGGYFARRTHLATSTRTGLLPVGLLWLAPPLLTSLALLPTMSAGVPWPLALAAWLTSFGVPTGSSAAPLHRRAGSRLVRDWSIAGAAAAGAAREQIRLARALQAEVRELSEPEPEPDLETPSGCSSRVRAAVRALRGA